jgi:hypothetical protein
LKGRGWKRIYMMLNPWWKTLAYDTRKLTYV